jgi:hypothetical protein
MFLHWQTLSKSVKTDLGINSTGLTYPLDGFKSI